MITTLALEPGGSSERLGTSTALDPLGFLAGRRYTCYCGRSVEGTMLCRSCADEMVACLVGAGERLLTENLQKLARTDH
jgi:hypothetical protein